MTAIIFCLFDVIAFWTNALAHGQRRWFDSPYITICEVSRSGDCVGLKNRRKWIVTTTSHKRWYSITVSTLACHAIGRGSIPRITASRNREKVSHRAHNPKLAVRLCLPQLTFTHSSMVELSAVNRMVVGSSPTGWAKLLGQFGQRVCSYHLACKFDSYMIHNMLS